MKWLPSFSLKFGLVHLWAGCTESDGRKIFLLAEEIPDIRVEFKIHWLTDETPFIALYLWPTIVGYFCWFHSHDPISKDYDKSSPQE